MATSKTAKNTKSARKPSSKASAKPATTPKFSLGRGLSRHLALALIILGVASFGTYRLVASHADVPSTVNTVPVYRFYSSASYDHLFTVDTNEVNNLRGTGYNPEGTPFKAFPPDAQADGTVPVYRLFNRSSGEHLLTKDMNERNTLLDGNHGDWYLDGVAFAEYDQPGTNRTAVDRLVSKISHTHVYDVAGSPEENSLMSSGAWGFEGVAFYAPADSVTSAQRANVQQTPQPTPVRATPAPTPAPAPAPVAAAPAAPARVSGDGCGANASHYAGGQHITDSTNTTGVCVCGNDNSQQPYNNPRVYSNAENNPRCNGTYVASAAPAASSTSAAPVNSNYGDGCGANAQHQQPGGQQIPDPNSGTGICRCNSGFTFNYTVSNKISNGESNPLCDRRNRNDFGATPTQDDTSSASAGASNVRNTCAISECTANHTSTNPVPAAFIPAPSGTTQSHRGGQQE